MQNDVPPQKPPVSFARQMALATELPFSLAGPIIVGGIAGGLLDHWLSTSPLFLLLLGSLGFVAGLRELSRRMKLFDSSKGGGDGQPRP